MNQSLRSHLSGNQYNLPTSVVDEVCTMFADEAVNLLDSLSNLKVEVRDTALRALREYYATIEKANNPVFTQVATVLSSDATNDGTYRKVANG